MGDKIAGYWKASGFVTIACMEERDILIIGAGPAGLSTAFHLCAINPSYSERLFVIDKQIGTRSKVCCAALGVDPLPRGEGISEALLGSKLAASEINDGFRRDDVRFTGYRHRILTSELGSSLRTTQLLARLFYSRMNMFWMNMILESRTLRRYIEEKRPVYPAFYRDKRDLLDALIRYALFRG